MNRDARLIFEAMQNAQSFTAESEESNIHMVAAAHLKPGDVLSHFKNTVLQVDSVAERLVKGKVRITYKDIRGVTHKVDWNKGTKISVDKASQENGEEGDLMRHMKEKGMVDKKATDDTGKYGELRHFNELDVLICQLIP